MSQPEISRRCLACGAAVRAGARFCPQCGQLMGDAEARGGGGVEQAEEAGAAAQPTPEKAATDDDLRLGESWRRWEASTGEHAGVKEENGRTESEADVSDTDVSEADVSEAAVEMSAPPPPMPPDAPSEPEGPRATRMEGAALPSGAATSPLFQSAPELKRRRGIVKESIRPRVEKVRDRSMIVLEEAAENTGLRFILIALVLFAIFLFFLFLDTKLR